MKLSALKKKRDFNACSQMIVLIFASGPSGLPVAIADISEQADLIIAADGGANHCCEIGIVPHIIIGDLDSIKPEVLTIFNKEKVSIKQHPKQKNATDLELALDLALEKAATAIRIVGALGGRWDMSLANILLAAATKYKDILVTLQDEHCTITIHHPDKQYSFADMFEKKISFLPLKNDVTGITLSGFEYPLNNHNISFGSTRGVSNVITSDKATEQHKDGILISVQMFAKP